VNFAIQCLPSQDTDNMVIPIGFNFQDGGIVTFNAENVLLPIDYKAILEDRLLNTFTELKSKHTQYVVKIAAGTTGIGRFYLHIITAPKDINPLNEQKITIFYLKKEIYIKGLVSKDAIATVYDLLGRKIIGYRLEPSDLNILKVDELKEGTFIINVSDREVMQTEKVFIYE